MWLFDRCRDAVILQDFGLHGLLGGGKRRFHRYEAFG